jgi:putative Mn2+ efflux pump MntP
MGLSTIILIAFGVSMDAFAVSITNGMVLKEVRLKDALRIGGFFGLFQAIMPLIGWLVGTRFQGYISKLDHWIAFLMLGIIGGKMIYEAMKSKEEGCPTVGSQEKSLGNKALLLLAIATSIDALVVGVSFALFDVAIIESVIIIGAITFVICLTGVLIGKKCGCLLGNYAEIVGGSVLVFIGVKIFIEHTHILSMSKLIGALFS